MSAPSNPPSVSDIARVRAYPPANDFWSWWELVKADAPGHVDMDRLASEAALHVTEKVKEAERGPAGRRVSVVKAQWWFFRRVSQGMRNQGARNQLFHKNVRMPKPRKRGRQYATLHRLERAGGFDSADDVADVFFAGWDLSSLGAAPRDDAHVMRDAPDDRAGNLTRRELRAVFELVVFRSLDLTIQRISGEVERGQLAPDRLVRERDAAHSFIWLRNGLDTSVNAHSAQCSRPFMGDNLLGFSDARDARDALPALLSRGQRSQHRQNGSWETWDD